MSSRRIGVLNGPNLNLLGRRDPKHYGVRTLSEIETMLRDRAAESGTELLFFQSNDEGALVDWIQESASALDGLLVNAAAYTHTSLALRDALAAAERPFVEVHLSNVYAREPFRRRSVIADLAIGVVAGFRASSYTVALDAILAHLEASGGS